MVIDLSPLYNFPSQFDRLFEGMWSPFLISQRSLAYPPLNLSETDDRIYARLEIPGLEIGEIDLTLTDASLVIKGERKPIKGKYYRQERPTGHFQRVINLHAPISRDAVTARMRDGLLEIVIPKAEESKPKKISIKAS